MRLAPGAVHVEPYDRLRDLPRYDQDLDGDEPPAVVRELRERISAADGLLIATPEYNYGVPGGLKSLVDWASRPVPGSALEHKPIAIMGAAPGNFGSLCAQLALRHSFLWTDSIVVRKPEVIVFRTGERLDGEGRLVDEGAAQLIVQLLEALRATIDDARSGRGEVAALR
ncbi:MAG TPA: NAD(P)H-dependent oxidoreductase [Acidimicrobiales bacterium]|nr:NAD(P)H-dependent oxidoreductase [Acidimicrobiales bacterium]